MGIMKFIKGQFIDVIECPTSDKDALCYRFEDEGNQIMMGAQLTVRPGQICVFVNEGQIADIFEPGRYELSTNNMPVLTVLKSWKYGFKSPFKADVYFIMTDDKIHQYWGTPSKITIKDDEFGMLRVGANGIYSYSVVDPNLFFTKLVGTKYTYTVSDCRNQLNSKLTSAFTDLFSESKVSLIEAYSNFEELSKKVIEASIPSFEQYGLQLKEFNIQELKIPEVVERAIDQRSVVDAIGGMDNYQRKVMIDAVGQATVKMAENEGGGGGIGPMGMQMSAGVTMGNMMANMINDVNPANKAVPATGAAIPQKPNTGANQTIVICPRCKMSLTDGAKFCLDCGLSMTQTQEATASCKKCQTPLVNGAKFCYVCGEKQED